MRMTTAYGQEDRHGFNGIPVLQGQDVTGIGDWGRRARLRETITPVRCAPLVFFGATMAVSGIPPLVQDVLVQFMHPQGWGGGPVVGSSMSDLTAARPSNWQIGNRKRIAWFSCRWCIALGWGWVWCRWNLARC
ncbi:hypothetical protein F5144DRAFT_587696 [Chaetomium tenue]|uniref:Uncharacterized protein n=1 Tax=Chaetomium tenue TaxID=1854479 RepID=A0ACB7NUB1_9PEZI|nr:hypothetical protein F5144DRAFT_587696 [Chaetomium globosum]